MRRTVKLFSQRWLAIEWAEASFFDVSRLFCDDSKASANLLCQTCVVTARLHAAWKDKVPAGPCPPAGYNASLALPFRLVYWTLLIPKPWRRLRGSRHR